MGSVSAHKVFIHCGHRRAVYRRKYRMDDPPQNEQPCRRREHGPQHQLVAVQPDRRKNPRLTCVGVGRAHGSGSPLHVGAQHDVKLSSLCEHENTPGP